MNDYTLPALTHWPNDELQRFLEIRQEFFLDPMGSNKDRFLEAAIGLQRALFDWYLDPPGKFEGMLALVRATAETWSELRKEERRTLPLRRLALNNASPDLPAVESSVSEHQSQKIFGSLGLGLADPGTFDRFLVQLDEETNPSLRVNHRYLGELLPHDNMISYLSSITATFLNENAIIGKVSPCVTHMEQAAVKWLLTLVGWDGGIFAADTATNVPVQRLPTLAAPAERYLRWEREEPTGTIVAGGTIANISALLIARSAVFDYLLGWSGAVQWLGPMMAWELIRKIWKKKRLVVLTSKGAHYSVPKAALQAGVAPGNVIEIPGSENPWILDGTALHRQLLKMDDSDLIVAVVAIAGKTETGYVDNLEEIAEILNDPKKVKGKGLKPFSSIIPHLRRNAAKIETAINSLSLPDGATKAFQAARMTWDEVGGDREEIDVRIQGANEVAGARHNRLFFHDVRMVTDLPLPAILNASDKQAAIQSAGSMNGTFESFRPRDASTVVPIAGGRFFRLSAGECNQLLLSYVPAREAKLIATASRDYWISKRGVREVLRVMRYLWRVNEHLWNEHIYANPHFTYYLGHTSLELALPSVDEGKSAADRLATLLTGWNAWSKQRDGRNPFLEVLAEYFEEAVTRETCAADTESQDDLKKYARKFFCHKIVVMHPYTDESLLGDMLRRLAFYGERSVIDVRIADATAQFFFRDKPPEPSK